MWYTDDADSASESPIIHRPAETPLILFRVVDFYCLQISGSVETYLEIIKIIVRKRDIIRRRELI